MEDSEADLYLQMYLENDLNRKMDNVYSYKLPQLIIFVLLEIGFNELDINLIENLLVFDKNLSYYELKLLGFSNEQISALFFLINPENEFSKKEVQNNCVKEDLKSKECSICLELFETRENIVKLPCHHFFHARCLAQWKSTCPYCRQPFEHEYPKLIGNWLTQCRDAVDFLNSIKENCNTGIKIVK